MTSPVSPAVFGTSFCDNLLALVLKNNHLSASSRIEQLTPINFEHFRSQTCSDDVSFGS